MFDNVASRKLWTSSNLPILSLAFSDLLTGLAFVYPTSWGFIILVTGYDFHNPIIAATILCVVIQNG
jgi:hypothetical protein